VFTRYAKDLTGVDCNLIKHKLNIDATVMPQRQKLKKMCYDKVVAVKSELQRLLDASVIREVMYPKWLANTVPVKNKNGKWRMCKDFTDLNKAAPNDNYPLPRMDQVIDSAASTAIMSLLDCSPVTINAGWRKRTRKITTLSHLLVPSVLCECPQA
jgi:hypothetical protein